MTPRFVFHPAARDDLLDARDWYESEQAGLGQILGQVVEEVLGRIATHPNLYPEIEPGIRRAVLSRFPYAVFYKQRTDKIEILAIFHHRRDPTTWQRRGA